jgi:hypothetical protein
MSMKYFGYENYATWCVSLWLGNDQATYEHWHEEARHCLALAPRSNHVQDGYATVNQAAVYLLSGRLYDAFNEGNPLREPEVWSDLLTAAVESVNWREVAEHLLADVLPPEETATRTPESSEQPTAATAASPLVLDLSNARFPLGFLGVTQGARAAVASGELADALSRHVRGDWGLVDAEDWQTNDRALVEHARLLSTFDTAAGRRFWIITEADRSSTTVLLPEEY